MASSIVFAATPATGFLSVPPLKARRFYVCSSLDNDVSDMSVKAPEPVTYKGPKLKVAIIGAGLAGMSTAVELLDQGHEDGREEIIQAWYMDDSEEDLRLRFHKDPKEFVSLDKLAEIDKLIGWTSKFLAWSVRRIVFISFIG